MNPVINLLKDKRLCFNNRAKIGSYIRLLLLLLLLLLKRSLIFYKIYRSANKQYFCDSNFESFLDNTINWYYTSMKGVF